MYTTTTQGEEILNLHVCSQGDRSLTDSITVRTLAGSGIEERPGDRVLAVPILRAAPNPVSDRGTSISFATSNSVRCRLALYDVTGSLVETLLDGQFGLGRHELQWRPAGQLPSGIYLLCLNTGTTATGCCVILE
ncbi:MAG: T9SS type A sorting domain-containing protein [candidate division WOR-3 bacterium]